MTLQQLKYIALVAEKGNITDAAKALYISQPSLTAAIKELEKDAIEKGFKNSHIVTGKKNHAAIRLYKKLGYFKTDNFEEFREDKIVICMKKNFKK